MNYQWKEYTVTTEKDTSRLTLLSQLNFLNLDLTQVSSYSTCQVSQRVSCIIKDSLENGKCVCLTNDQDET